MTLHTPYPRPHTPLQSVPSYVSATLRLSDPSSDVLVRHVRLLRNCVALAQQRWGFEIEAASILPNEMHLLCAFDDQDFAIGAALKLIAVSFARHLPDASAEIWADTSEVTEIATAMVQLQRIQIENAPVRARLVQTARDWPYSSVHTAQVGTSDLGAVVA